MTTTPNEPRSALLEDYNVFVRRFHEHTGLDLHQYKRPQMERRLRTFARELGFGDLVSFERAVRTDTEMAAALYDRITINVSQLWRNPVQWETLQRSIFPELLADGRPFAAWSAGCSYGAEAFSLAAICAEMGVLDRTRISATDIDRHVLERGRQGTFADSDARTMPPKLLERWFEPVASEGGRGHQARRELRNAVEFRKHDLLAPGRDRSYDLILCRNVLIYFTEEACRKVHARLAAALRPGGYLMIGATERIRQPLGELRLTSPQTFIFRKEGR
jgi:chemotaxis protein methyltransferase CheR